MNAKVLLVAVGIAAVSIWPKEGYGLDQQYMIPAGYDFVFEAQDPQTHDIKRQKVRRDGDVVKGEYSLKRPDGTVKVEKYLSNEKNGFNAFVKMIGRP